MTTEFKRIKYPHELIDVTKLFSILDNLDYRLTSIEETIKQIREKLKSKDGV